MAKKKNWIQDMNMDEGAMTKQAKAMGMTPMQFAAKNKSTKGKTGKRARLAITLSKLNKKK